VTSRIHAMDIRKIDLNLLVAFDAVLDRRNVTRAGEAIGLSQPAMSAALGRLRAFFDDPLFVKAGPEMKPTPRALELAPAVHAVIATIKSEILQSARFDPAATERIFTIVTPDIGEIRFVPPLLRRIAELAPKASLRASARPRNAAAEALESGAAQLAIGYFPDLRATGFYKQKLFENAHVCIVGARHAPAGGRLTLNDYLARAHAVVRPEGREHVFDQFLQQRGIERRIVLELSNFMSLLPIIEGTDLIATVPQDLATICQRYARIRILEVPIKAPAIPIHQFWHRRFNADAENAWLRGVVHGLFSRAGRRAPVHGA
jgi:DNA-binding transcriptional LysR family regulator